MLTSSLQGQSEIEARSIFPETTIVRPSPMYGFEDRLLHSIAQGTDFLSSNRWKQKSWPVHVMDVGRALEIMAYDDSTAGQTFELCGPREYSREQIAHLVYRLTSKKKPRINLPKPLAKAVAGIMNYAWWPTYCADEIEREFIDQKIDPTAKTFKDLDLTPGELDDMAFEYVRNYRSVARSHGLVLLFRSGVLTESCVARPHTLICRQ